MSKLDDAVAFMIECHDGQTRKGRGIPYFSHPLSVASLVLQYGGDEDQAIAALLHDTIEDCAVTRRQLEKRYGRRVARMVEECSDHEPAAPGAKKPPWKGRKLAYIAHLKEVSNDTLLVSACDKLHNARAIVHDVRHEGRKVWKRFNPTPAEVVWYYNSLLAAYRARRAPFAALLRELARVVKQLESLAQKA